METYRCLTDGCSASDKNRAMSERLQTRSQGCVILGGLMLEMPIDGGHADVEHLSNLGHSVLSGVVELLALSIFLAFITEGRPPTRPRALAAARPAWVRSRMRSLSNSAKRAHDGEEQAAIGGRGVDGLRQTAEADSSASQVLHKLDQIPEGAPQPVQPPNHHHIARTQLVEHPVQFGSAGFAAGGMVSEDLDASSLLQCVDLKGGVLVVRADPCVSNPSLPHETRLSILVTLHKY